MTTEDTPVPGPDLASTYDLSPNQTARYQRDGHVLLRGVASADELRIYRPPSPLP